MFFFRPRKKIENFTRQKDRETEAITKNHLKRANKALKEQKRIVKKLDNGWAITIYKATR